MYQRTKRRIITILATVFMATLALFCLTLMPNTYSAKAELVAPTNVKTDALGFLRWDKVSGAAGYEWSYSTDGTSYTSGGTVDETEADISAAITEAIKLARENSQTSATLNLKVKATGGAETAFTYTFDKYINYGYKTRDIADVYAGARTGVTGNFVATSGLYTNELMTFGFSVSQFLQSGSTSKTDFYVGMLNSSAAAADTNVANTTNYYYRLRFETHGWTKIQKGGTIAFNQDIGGDMVVNQPSYFAVGVFDTYNVLDGSVAGETVYFRRTDVVNGEASVVYATGITTGKIGNNPVQTFFTTTESADRPSHLPDAKNHTVVNDRTETVNNNRTGTRPKSTFAISSANDSNIKTVSGKIPASSGVAMPTMVHYDNITGQVQWNRVENATGYEWSYAGSNVWTEATKEFIPDGAVATAIQSAKDSGAESVRFAVRAVNDNGKSNVEYAGLDLTAFYGKKSTLKDISNIFTNLQNPTEALAGSYAYSNSGYAINTFVENTFTFDNITNWQRRFAASMLASGDGQWNGYDVTIHAQGYITISTGLQWQVNQLNLYWQNSQAVKFEIGKTYVATYGVEELFDLDGEKVADRVSVKVSEVEADGYRKVLTIVSYDNYEYNWKGVKIPTLNAEGTYTNKQINYHITSVESSTAYCKVSCASLVRDIAYVTNGVTHSNPATYTVGDTFTFAVPTAIPTGYVFEGWYLDADYTQEAVVTADTYSDLKVYAKLKQLYTITILDKDGNEVTTEYAENDEYALPAYSDGVIGYEIDGKLYKAGDVIEVTENTTIQEVWFNFVMEDGAAVRLSSAGEYYGGLRFTITADSAMVEKYGFKVFGMIVPTAEISGEFDGVGETPAVEELEVNKTEGGLNVYRVTLTNVLYTNYNRAFSARAYVEVVYETGVEKVYTTYSAENNSRSVYQVACMATADDAVTKDEKDVLANYLSYTVNLVLVDGVYSVATTQDNLPSIGERKYTVENNVLTLSDIPQNLAAVLAADRPYVPVTVWSADGTTCERMLVRIELSGTTATATLVVE